MAEHFKAVCKWHGLTEYQRFPSGQVRCRLCKSADSKKYNRTGKGRKSQKASNDKRRRRNVEYISEQKQFGCVNCGYDKCISALHFHHTNGDNKDNTVAKLVQDCCSIKTIADEVSKCILLCANCHAEVHAGLIQLAEEK